MRKAASDIPVSRSRSYGMVVDYLLRFAMTRIVEGADTQYPRTTGSTVGFAGGMLSNSDARVGDLVRIEAAGPSKWTLSWLREIRYKHGDREYLCESLLDGQLCWWSNVSVSYFHRPTVEMHPEWRWTDAQHDFYTKWGKACDRHDPHLYRPVLPTFNDDGSVILGTRSRHDFDGHRATYRLASWKKATIKALEAVYLHLVEEHKALPAKEQAQ